MVMELLEGQTLRERIGGRSMPLDPMLDYAIQIADALNCRARARRGPTATSSPRTFSSPSAGRRKNLGFRFGEKQGAGRRVGEFAGVERGKRADPAHQRFAYPRGSTMGHGRLHVSRAGAWRRAGCADRPFQFRLVLYEWLPDSLRCSAPTHPLIF